MGLIVVAFDGGDKITARIRTLTDACILCMINGQFMTLHKDMYH